MAGGDTLSGVLSTAEVYDPSTGTWSSTGNLVGGREQHTFTLLPSGKVLAAGGHLGAALSTAETYNPAGGDAFIARLRFAGRSALPADCRG